MDHVKKIAGVACLALALIGVGSATAADETITLSTSVVPNGGKLYKEVRVPANMSLSVQVHTPASSGTINPLKRATMEFPTDLTYNPNNEVTPVCTDSQLNEQSNLAAGVAAIVAACPKSVIGTGTANIYLAKLNQPFAFITDPQLVIFNAGRDDDGNAQMKIYAYSGRTHYGILMHGSLTPKGIQDVFIPVLSADSATSEFTLSIPGPGIEVETGSGATQTVKGLDPNYARARCSTGTWTTRGTFTLGERSFPGGTDTSPSTIVEATPYTTACKGLAGHPRLAGAKAVGPKRLRRGARKVFKVKVRNKGTATAKVVKIKASGSGRGQKKAFKIQPGGTRWTRVPVRITGRKGSAARIVFRLVTKGSATKAVARGRIIRR